MKKQKFSEKLRSVAGILSIAFIVLAGFEAFIEVEGRAIQNKRSITILVNEMTDIFTKYHTTDLRISRLETIKDLQLSKRLV